MKKVTGVGGVFFKSKDTATTKDWYRDNLGFKIDEWGAAFVWSDIDTNNKQACSTAWSPFKDDSNYFGPGTLPYMINYRVADLKNLIDTLRSDGVTIAGGIDEYDYGKFAWIMDPEGRKIELWEPIDAGFGITASPWPGHVVGLAGIFIRSDDPDKTKEWYKKHLDVDDQFQFRDLESGKEVRTTWTALDKNDKLFAGTDKPYMYNYRVRDLKALIDDLKNKNITVSTDKFSWTIDPDGNKVLLSQL